MVKSSNFFQQDYQVGNLFRFIKDFTINDYSQMDNLEKLYEKYTSVDIIEKAIKSKEGFDFKITSPKTNHSIKSKKSKIRCELDLHGLDRKTAKKEIIGFIDYCAKKHLSKVRIITGKGSGALRAESENVLSNLLSIGKILDFSTAPSRQGGDGAFIVII